MGRFRAIPYAKALLAVVEDQAAERKEAVADELDRVAATFAAVPEFERVLVTPILDSVLDELEIEEPVRRFLHVVQHHYRMQHIADIADTYRKLVDRSLGRVRARVETVVPLDESERRQLVEAVSAVEGATVVADFQARPELLGGFRLQVGSRVIDGSLAGELDRLSQEIKVEQG